MPIYKGSNEVTSGNLHKGSTEIENGYKGTDSFYLNETTVSWATPTGQGLTYTVPSPQSSSGSPGSTFPTTTFTATIGGNQRITGGSISVSGLPSTLTASLSSPTSGLNNSITINITGTFPVTGSLNTALTVSGISTLQFRSISFTFNTTLPGNVNDSHAQGGSVGTGVSHPDGVYNASVSGSTWTGYVPNNSAATVNTGISMGNSGTVVVGTTKFLMRMYIGSVWGTPHGASAGASYNGSTPTTSGGISYSSQSNSGFSYNWSGSIPTSYNSGGSFSHQATSMIAGYLYFELGANAGGTTTALWPRYLNTWWFAPTGCASNNVWYGLFGSSNWSQTATNIRWSSSLGTVFYGTTPSSSQPKTLAQGGTSNVQVGAPASATGSYNMTLTIDGFGSLTQSYLLCN